MGNQKALAPIEERQFSMIENAGAILDTETNKALAVKLMLQWRGRTAGGYFRDPNVIVENGIVKNAKESHRKSIDPETRETIYMLPVPGKYDRGDLLYGDALQKVTEVIPIGLNPLAHIDIWYMQGVCLHSIKYKIRLGFARWMFPDFDTKTLPMEAEERERYGLQGGDDRTPPDAASVAYLLKDRAARLEYASLLAMLIKEAGMDYKDANRAALEATATARGVGIVLGSEPKQTREVKGRGRGGAWRSEKRALTDLLNRFVGDMPPGQLKEYMSRSEAVTLTAQNLKVLAEHPASHELGEGDQNRILQLADTLNGQSDGMSFNERVELTRGDDFADPDVDAVFYDELEPPGFELDFSDAELGEFDEEPPEMEPEAQPETEEPNEASEQYAKSVIAPRAGFELAVKQANANKTGAHLANFIRRFINADFPKFYKSDEQIRAAYKAATGKLVRAWPPRFKRVSLRSL